MFIKKIIISKMKIEKSLYALALGLMLAPVPACAADVVVTVANNSDVQRQELVEIIWC